jgi:putative ABC transport system substrate-binding protein
MGKRFFGLTLSALLSAFSFPAEAQQPGKGVHRIGVLWAGSATGISTRLEAFRQGLRDLGYVEKNNIVFEYRFADGKPDRLPALAAELVRLNVDVIVTTAIATRPAKEATNTIPIVTPQFGDPVASGLVASLARPGGNITGLSQLGPELAGKRLELLKETVPKITRVAYFRNPATPGTELRGMQAVAPALGLQLQFLEVRSPNDFDSAFKAALKERANALSTATNPVITGHKERIMDFAAKNRLPAIYPRSEFVDAGGLMFYGVNFLDLWRRAATYVDKILKGTQPAELPVEQPTKFEFIINLKAAKQIGLTIPPNVLARADRVIR